MTDAIKIKFRIERNTYYHKGDLYAGRVEVAVKLTTSIHDEHTLWEKSAPFDDRCGSECTEGDVEKVLTEQAITGLAKAMRTMMREES